MSKDSRKKKGRLVFITGGARSGKSAFALETARAAGGEVAYIATCGPRDAEMRRRIAKHRDERPKEWKTVEEELFAADAVRALPKNIRVVILDCITLLVSNMMLAKWSDARIEEAINELADAAVERPGVFIVVTNEVGCGIVPDNALSRRFRDVAGRANAALAARADEAYILFCGIPVELKKSKGRKQRGFD